MMSFRRDFAAVFLNARHFLGRCKDAAGARLADFRRKADDAAEFQISGDVRWKVIW